MDIDRNLFQVLYLGMTTNERMNKGRYKHFQSAGGRSPFSRGFLNNCADFIGMSICGLAQPKNTDWMKVYHSEQTEGAGADRWKYV